MAIQGNITYSEKPEYITFDDIHNLLWKANEQNRKDGFVLSTSRMSGKELQNRIGNDGHCFVALSEGQLVGTLSLRYINSKSKYAHGKMAIYMLAGVLPEFQGQHINTGLSKLAFETAVRDGCRTMELDTAESNKHAINVYKHLGFKLVSFKSNPNGDHYSVVMMKWFEKCPVSSFYLKTKYLMKKFYVKIRYTPGNK